MEDKPCGVIKDRFRRFHELVAYDDARREINHTHLCQLLAILSDILQSIQQIRQFELGDEK